MSTFITFYIPTGSSARQEIKKTGYCWSNLHHLVINIWMNVTLVESSCKGDQEKLEILLKLLVILQVHGIEWFQAGRNSREWCGIPLCEVFNSQCFPGLFTDKNNFFQVKMYSELFLTVTYNLMHGKIAKASIILILFSNSRNSPGHLKTAIFKTFLSLETDIGDNLICPYFQNLQEAWETLCWPVKVGGKTSNFGGLESVNVFDVNGLAKGVFMGIAARIARLAFNEMNEIENRDVNF